MSISPDTCGLPELLLALEPNQRALLLQAVVSFRPQTDFQIRERLRPYRAAFEDYWEKTEGYPVPAAELRSALSVPISIETILEFQRIKAAQSEKEVGLILNKLVSHLKRVVRRSRPRLQRYLFEDETCGFECKVPKQVGGDVTDSLYDLASDGRKFSTIYADPPWQYANTSSRAAAENHYQTMSLREICEAIKDLTEENAHLHLWTTNAFLEDAFKVIDAWGFTFKSVLVWVKDEMGMGNYWRVSHEFLLLGVRGKLTFRDRGQVSWIQAHRTVHSRKPSVVRAMIEKVSPGPYLELFGRERMMDSQWTVYGNQVENKLF
jgi:N6-adenosine-specific RNA methylase IME4